MLANAPFYEVRQLPQNFACKQSGLEQFSHRSVCWCESFPLKCAKWSRNSSPTFFIHIQMWVLNAFIMRAISHPCYRRGHHSLCNNICCAMYWHGCVTFCCIPYTYLTLLLAVACFGGEIVPCSSESSGLTPQKSKSSLPCAILTAAATVIVTEVMMWACASSKSFLTRFMLSSFNQIPQFLSPDFWHDGGILFVSCI